MTVGTGGRIRIRSPHADPPEPNPAGILAGQTALVTGASGGIGLAVSVALAEAGCRVYAGMRNPAAGGPELLGRAGGADSKRRISSLPLDVTDPGSIRAAVSAVMDESGRIDILVNNAGIAVGGFVEETPVEDWRRQFEVNLFGVVAVTREVLPAMRRQRSGLILTVSSISGRAGFPGLGPYAASKFAAEGLCESLRHELKPHGIRVVLVEPGAYRTPIWERSLGTLAPDPNSPYSLQMQDVLAHARKAAAGAPDPAEAAQAIVRIASLPRPRLRYPLGRGVRLTLAGRALLPWKLFERLVAAALRRHRR